MYMYLNFLLACLTGLSAYFLSSKVTYWLWLLMVLAVLANFAHHASSSLNLSF